MTTPRVRAIVSRAARPSLARLAAAATLTVALGACAGGPPPDTSPAPAAAAAHSPTIRFDNEARLPVHVYLITERREWLLGRVEPGARATLRIPARALSDAPGYVRLAALADAPVSFMAARDPRAILAIAQPASMLVTQRWTFTQLAGPQLYGARVAGGRR